MLGSGATPLSRGCALLLHNRVVDLVRPLDLTHELLVGGLDDEVGLVPVIAVVVDLDVRAQGLQPALTGWIVLQQLGEESLLF